MRTLRALLVVAVVLSGLLRSGDAWAIINQVDGVIVPQDTTLQACLDKPSASSTSNPAPGEGFGVLNAITNAAITPQTFVPSVRTDGRRIAQFTMVGEGAGYQARFGWYNVGDSPFVPGSRQQVYACRDLAASCDCPCTGGSRRALPPDGTCTHWVNPNIVELDFDCFRSRGMWRGGPIAFYIMTPEVVADGETFDCAPLNATDRRVYSTDNSINDDGDYVHFLIYSSRTFRDGFYFAWEDLFRGGDNDFEDVLVRSIGLVPVCNPVPEVCDGRDNNCNGMIDDGLGTTTCGVGACRRTVENCQAGAPVTCTPGPASVEACDNVDNNCNGMVDEGVSRPCTRDCGAGTQYCSAGVWGDCNGAAPLPEVCDNIDNNCNGMIDDGLSRPCSTTCGSGREVCAAGTWGSCSATSPVAEVCDGLDNDCDGTVDEGVPARPCTAAELRCGPGMAVCVGGRFVCSAPPSRPEFCDGIDNDCNGMVDDGIPSAGTCGLAAGVCRAGTFECRGGRFVCNADETGRGDEVCDGLDNNCNGLIDEGNPGGGASCMTGADGAPLCSAGTMRCRDGRLACLGGRLGSPERCNCDDDDCDGTVDEAPAGGSLCAAGSECVRCLCRPRCRTAPPFCSTGLECGDAGVCVPEALANRCGDAVCELDQGCVDGRCVGCDDVPCTDGQTCMRGACVEDSCYQRGCSSGQLCLSGVCVNDPCRTLTCAQGQYCRPEPDGTGRCVRSCVNVSCGAGQSCRDGACVSDPCAGVRCARGEVCRVEGTSGTCGPDPCAGVSCTGGRRCVEGRCEDNPCAYVTCPGMNAVCRGGQCVDGVALPSFVTPNPASAGCGCRAVAHSVPHGSGWFVFALGTLAVGRRRGRRPRRTR